jgi:nucleoid-associated protein
VADFFMDFLGASEGLNAKAQNRGLLQAVDDFAADAQLDKSERQNVPAGLRYCNEQLQAGEEIELESLSKELAGVSERASRNSPLSRAMSWKRASRRIAARCVS